MENTKLNIFNEFNGKTNNLFEISCKNDNTGRGDAITDIKYIKQCFHQWFSHLILANRDNNFTLFIKS